MSFVLEHRSARIGLYAALPVVLTSLIFALGMAFAGTASAATVGNPGQFTAEVTGGTLKIKGFEIDLGGLSPSPTLTGTVDEDGEITIPSSGVSFPGFVYDSGSGTVMVRIQSSGSDWTGNIDPATGEVDLDARLRIRLEPTGLVPLIVTNCFIGAAGTGSNLHMAPAVTGTESANPPAPEMAGTAYDQEAGTATLVNNRFAVPPVSGCGPSIVDAAVNTFLGLPSSSGNNQLEMELAFDPVIEGPGDPGDPEDPPAVAIEPGEFSAEISEGRIKIGAVEQAIADINPKPTVSGEIDEQDHITIPSSGVNFPPVQEDTGMGVLTIKVQPTGTDWTGDLDPDSGEMTLEGRLRIKFEGVIAGTQLGDNCYAGAAGTGSNIHLNPLTTEAIPANGAAPAMSGSPYDSDSSQASLVNNTATVPPLFGCGFIALGTALGLPSPSGSNEFEFGLTFDRSLTADPEPPDEPEDPVPVSTSDPVLVNSSGNVAVTINPNHRLICQPGTWTDAKKITYQWTRDAGDGPEVFLNLKPNGQNNDVYRPTYDDVGTVIACAQVARNDYGQTISPASNAASVVGYPVPVELSAPSLVNSSGNVVPSVTRGKSLTCIVGQWEEITGLTYQWTRDTGDGPEVFLNLKPNGQNKDVYRTVPSDVGSVIACANVVKNKFASGVVGTASNSVLIAG